MSTARQTSSKNSILYDDNHVQEKNKRDKFLGGMVKPCLLTEKRMGQAK